jgi:hypothetical protein
MSRSRLKTRAAARLWQRSTQIPGFSLLFFLLGVSFSLLLHWLQRNSVFASKVNAALTVPRVPARLMFNMIFAAVICLLHPNAHRTMTIQAANGLVRGTYKRNRHLDPAPLQLAGKATQRKLLLLLALSHRVMHGSSLRRPSDVSFSSVFPPNQAIPKWRRAKRRSEN